MLLLIFVATILVAAGTGAGFFLGGWPILALSVFGVGFVAWVLYETREDVAAGNEGGTIRTLLCSGTLFFLVPMWMTAIVVRIVEGISPVGVDWTSIGEWLRSVFLR